MLISSFPWHLLDVGNETEFVIYRMREDLHIIQYYQKKKVETKFILKNVENINLFQWRNKENNINFSFIETTKHIFLFSVESYSFFNIENIAIHRCPLKLILYFSKNNLSFVDKCFPCLCEGRNYCFYTMRGNTLEVFFSPYYTSCDRYKYWYVVLPKVPNFIFILCDGKTGFYPIVTIDGTIRIKDVECEINNFEKALEMSAILRKGLGKDVVGEIKKYLSDGSTLKMMSKNIY